MGVTAARAGGGGTGLSGRDSEAATWLAQGGAGESKGAAKFDEYCSHVESGDESSTQESEDLFSDSRASPTSRRGEVDLTHDSDEGRLFGGSPKRTGSQVAATGPPKRHASAAAAPGMAAAPRDAAMRRASGAAAELRGQLRGLVPPLSVHSGGGGAGAAAMTAALSASRVPPQQRPRSRVDDAGAGVPQGSAPTPRRAQQQFAFSPPRAGASAAPDAGAGMISSVEENPYPAHVVQQDGWCASCPAVQLSLCTR